MSADTKVEFLHQDGSTIVIRVQLDVYGLQPILKAAHKFTNHSYVHLELEAKNTVLCRLKPKNPLDDIKVLGGEFTNELLDQKLRANLASQTESVRKLLLAQAFSKVDLIHPEFDSADPFEDPKGIQQADDQS